MTVVLTGVLATAKDININQKLECSKIGLYDPKTGRCYLGPNDKFLTEFGEYERRVRKALINTWKWNHGKDVR